MKNVLCNFTADHDAVELTLCCNETFLYGELTIHSIVAVDRGGQSLQYSCYDGNVSSL